MNSTGRAAKLIKSRWTERLLMFVLVPALLLYSAWLPPFDLDNRVLRLDHSLVTEEGGVVAGPGGASLTIPQGAVVGRARIKLGTVQPGGRQVDAASFIAAVADGDTMGLPGGSSAVRAAQEIPAGVSVHGPLYQISAHGSVPSSALLTLPLPETIASSETTDVFCWSGGEWQWTASEASAGGSHLVAHAPSLPELAVVVQSAPAELTVAAEIDAANVPAELAVSTYYVDGARVGPEGTLTGVTPNSTQETTFLSVSNRSSTAGGPGDLGTVLATAEGRSAHTATLVAAARDNGYAGIHLDYVGLDPSLRSAFTAFVEELSGALHEEGLLLALRLDASRQSDAYDWVALGRVADVVRVPALADPSAYTVGGEMDELLSWATRRVDRRKLELVISVAAREVVEGAVYSISYQEALGRLAAGLTLDGEDDRYLPGDIITVSLPELSDASLEYDEDAQAYWFEYSHRSTGRHTVWLETGSSVARKLQLVRNHALSRVSFTDWTPGEADEGILAAVQSYQDNVAPLPAQYALVWALADEAGSDVQRRVAPANSARASWRAPDDPGRYTIRAALSDDGGLTSLGEPVSIAFIVPTATPTPSPVPTDTPTPVPTAAPTNTPAPPPTVDPNAPQPTATPTAAPTAQLPPPPPPSGGGSFGYGVQAAMVADGDHERIFGHIQGMGFNWVKQQVEWFRYNPAPGVYEWGPLDRIVEGANARGIHILFSVVKAPEWARPAGDDRSVAGPPADPNTYGAFVREMAARYKGRVRAYEIWNEQNLWYEWGGRGRRLNAAAYVDLLRVAYANIKAVDPGAIVVSGALTPTGFNDGDTAIDDRIYLEQMYQAGLKNYCDAVGAHPSGYNNPPDSDWRTWSDPSAPSFKGHPSFFFRGTMESYRNIMVKYGDGGKRIWVTEFGWASVENLGAGPAAGYEYAADNSEAEQAAYLVRAYQMGRSWGWVGPMFLWNLNFAPVSGIHDEKAAFGIVRGDWSPRPAYAALRDMPK